MTWLLYAGAGLGFIIGFAIAAEIGRYVYNVKMQEFQGLAGKIDTDLEKIKIAHFEQVHFTAQTIGGRKFLYCPVGNICSWSEGDYDHKWCEWCQKYFTEMMR